MANPVLTVVGSSNTDIVVRVPHIPLPGETLIGGDAVHIPGGKGANQAVAARRIGADVYFVGCLGDDSYGNAATANLASEGLRLDHLAHIAGVPSGVALIAVAENGENSIVVATGANARLTATDVDHAASAIQISDIVIAQLEIPITAVHQAFRLAREVGVGTLLNPAPAQPLTDSLMALVDILVCNETEAEALTSRAVTDQASAIAAAHALLNRGPELVIVTLGGNGCLVATADAITHVPAFAVPVVDSTAAGDAFIGALACRLAQGDVPEAAARYATAAAALSVGVAGAQPSLPSGARVNTFLKVNA